MRHRSRTWLCMLAVVTGIFCAVRAPADYVADRKAALELVKTGKHDDALSAFLKMAESAGSEAQKSDALEQAVAGASSLQQYDRAMELAKQIPLAPVSKLCQMRILDATRRWQELVDTFGPEDLERWPDGVNAEAYHLRGNAYRALQDGVRAEADLKKAGEYLTEDNSKGLALNALGDTYATLLNDDNRAIEAHRKVYTTRALYKQCQAAISIAGIFLRQQRVDDAIQELSRFDMTQVTVPYWRAAMLSAFGDAFARQGKKAEAIGKYKEALQVEGIYPVQKAACEKALSELQGDAR